MRSANLLMLKNLHVGLIKEGRKSMDKTFDIQSYMTQGVERIVSDAVRATLKNPRESAYMARFVLASRAASKKRRKAEDAGERFCRTGSR